MNGTAQAVADYAAAWPDTPPGVDVVFCPPWAYLDRLASALHGRGIRFGVQTTALKPHGAYTGEHAAEMAADLGARFAIVGHSERRRLFGETDAVAAGKLEAAQRAGLTPILCVGETLAERQAGTAEATVIAQLDAAWPSAGDALVAAYEPVWAIGTGENATPALAQAMHVRIRAHSQKLAARRNAAIAVRVVYGGSVNAANAAALFAERDIDGGLVGGASLDAKTFAAICEAAAQNTGTGH
jgi:triosephosphate isomerase